MEGQPRVMRLAGPSGQDGLRAFGRFPLPPASVWWAAKGERKSVLEFHARNFGDARGGREGSKLELGVDSGLAKVEYSIQSERTIVINDLVVAIGSHIPLRFLEWVPF